MRISDWSSDVCSSDLSPPTCWPHPRRPINGNFAPRPATWQNTRLVGSPCPTSRSSPGRMAKDDVIEFEGTSSETMPNTMFREKRENGHEIIADISGRLRKDRKDVGQGKRVTVRVEYGDAQTSKK